MEHYKSNKSITYQYKGEDITARQVKLSDWFSVDCGQCTKCCTDLIDGILLSPRDIFNIAKELNLTTQEVIDRYCHIYLGRYSRDLHVALMPNRYKPGCPLFQNNKCLVKNAKPELCALFPIGRNFPEESENSPITDKSIEYYLSPPLRCPISKKHTLKGWLQSRGISVNDAFPAKWNRVRQRITSTIKYLEETYPNDNQYLKRFCNIVSAIYVRYDTNSDFEPQFENNREHILRYIDGVDEGYYEFEKFFTIN